MSSEFYIIGGKEQRHSNEMTMVWKPRGESVVFPEYEGKVCGFCCRNCTWEQVLEFGVPGDVKVKVRKGTDIFDTHESFACVSGRMKCFLLSVDDSLRYYRGNRRDLAANAELERFRVGKRSNTSLELTCTTAGILISASNSILVHCYPELSSCALALRTKTWMMSRASAYSNVPQPASRALGRLSLPANLATCTLAANAVELFNAAQQ